jgi:hypothetical protein
MGWLLLTLMSRTRLAPESALDSVRMVRPEEVLLGP